MKLHSPTPRTVAAFTLIEIKVGLAIASVVLAGIGSFSMFTLRSFVALGNYADLDRASRNALDVMTRDVREARAVTYYHTNRITLTAQDNTALEYKYDERAATLTRTAGGQSSVLLEQCDYLKFAIYQRKPMANFQFYPATNSAGVALPSTAKLIDVSWRCSRQIYALKVNTESVQTAKIVIRN